MKNIIENNILLAEFLGATKTDLKGRQKPVWYPILGASHTQLHFHKDWNWLMEVVYKIENNHPISVIISCSDCEVYNCETQETIFHLEGVKIEAVYNTCVEFVKWYNSQNK